MSAVTTEPTHEHENVSHDPSHVAHPSDWLYVKVALFLAALTALEVATYFWEDIFGSKPSTTALVLTLFPMMIIKFGTVIMYFMHLKYDNPLFRRVFLFGLGLAIVVFLIALTSFNYWWDDYLRFLTGG
jgi:cytochrome c oxidase subunit 4